LLVPSTLPQSRLPAIMFWPLGTLPELLPEPLPLELMRPPLPDDDPPALPLLELPLLVPLDPPVPELPPPVPPSGLAGWFDEQRALAEMTATNATRITQSFNFMTFSPVPEGWVSA
jgi:hypothetical protein